MKKIHLLIAIIAITSKMVAQNVGIGTTSPSAKLEVVGELKITNASYGLFHTDGTTSVGTYVDGEAGWIGTFSDHPLWFFTANGSVPPLVVDITGNVGIGTTTPDAKLQVQGQVKIVDGSQGANKVLTSDDTGLATWQPIGLMAFGYAVGQNDHVIGADADVVFDLGATPFPNAGFSSVPAPGGTSFVIAATGVYEFDFYISGLPSSNVPLEFALWRNGIVAGNAFEFRSSTTSSATNNLTVIGHGIIQLTAGDTITLHNRTNTVVDTVIVTSVPPGGEAGANRTLTLKRIN